MTLDSIKAQQDAQIEAMRRDVAALLFEPAREVLALVLAMERDQERQKKAGDDLMWLMWALRCR